MNCRRAQTDIALWAGNDLDETDCQSLARHLEACPQCRDYRAHMEALWQLMDECPLRDEADEASKSAVADGLWPSLSSRLVSLPSPKSDRFNGWIPAVAVAAVCLAMLMVASPQDAFPPQSSAVPADSDSEWPDDAQSPTSSRPASAPEPISEEVVRPPITGIRVDERESRQLDFSEWNRSLQNVPSNSGKMPEDFPQEDFPQTELQDFPFPPVPDDARILWRPPVVLIIE